MRSFECYAHRTFKFVAAYSGTQRCVFGWVGNGSGVSLSVCMVPFNRKGVMGRSKLFSNPGEVARRRAEAEERQKVYNALSLEERVTRAKERGGEHTREYKRLRQLQLAERVLRKEKVGN